MIKKLILLFTTLLITFFISSSEEIKLNEEHNYFEVTEKSASEFSFINHFSKINTQLLKTKEGDFVKLIVNGYVTDKKFGKPELPVLKKILRVPFGGQAVVKIINKQEQIISLSDYGIYLPIFPNQPSISKGDNADDVPFIFDRGYYKINQLSENIPIKIELLGKMREMQMARLHISPFSYNPVTNEIKIIGIISLLVLFWPIMSTGSFLKNWNMIFICYLVGIVFGLKTKEFKFH